MHEKREEIEELIFELEFADIVEDFEIMPKTIKQHVEHSGMYKSIEKFQRAVLMENLMAIKSGEKVPYAYRLGLAEQMNRMVGVYKDSAVDSDVEFLRKLIASRRKESLSAHSVLLENKGDLIEVQEVKQEDGINQGSGRNLEEASAVPAEEVVGVERVSTEATVY